MIDTESKSAEAMATPQKKEKKPRHILRWVFIGIILLIVLWIGSTALGIYSFKWDNNFINISAATLHLPAASAEGEFISYKEYHAQYKTLKHYYDQQASMDLPLVEIPEGKSIQEVALDRLIKSKLTEIEAGKRGITVTQEDIDNEFNQFILPESGGIEEIEKSLNDLYLWTVDDFKQNIVREFLLRDKLFEVIIQDADFDAEKRQKAEDVLARVLKGDVSFEELAKQYSEDPTTASSGGDLGFFKADEMTKPFAEAVAGLKVGEVSGVVRTQFGFHIIKLDQKVDGADGLPESADYSARHILILGTTLDEVLDDIVGKANIEKFIHF